MERTYVSVGDVLLAHEKALRHGGGVPGVRDRAALEAAVFRPQCGYYADMLEEAAALMESLVMNHPFVDANKRTAFLATDLFLNYNGLFIAVSGAAGEEFFLDNLSTGKFRFAVIVDWLRRVTREIA